MYLFLYLKYLQLPVSSLMIEQESPAMTPGSGHHNNLLKTWTDIICNWHDIMRTWHNPRGMWEGSWITCLVFLELFSNSLVMSSRWLGILFSFIPSHFTNIRFRAIEAFLLSEADIDVVHLVAFGIESYPEDNRSSFDESNTWKDMNGVLWGSIRSHLQTT